MPSIKGYGLVRELSNWEVNRTERLVLEDRFNAFTGHIDIFELHVPYTRYDLLEKAFKETSKLKGKKMCVFNGDVANLDSFSRYHLTSRDTSKPWDEINSFIKVLKVAEKIYDHIIFVKANHDNRLLKVLTYMSQDKEQIHEIEKFIKTYKELFEESGVFNIVISPQYIFQVGKAIFTHIEKNHRNPYTTAFQIWEDLVPRMAKAWDIVYQSHTHKQHQFEIGGKRIVMTGCLTGKMDYPYNGKMKYKFSTIGYGVCDMTKGEIDWDKSTYKRKDTEGYI